MTFTLENFPAGVRVDAKKLAAFMERRAPGRDKLSTARRETDEVVWRGGFAADGTTSGETIVGEIASRDMRPGDYGAERTIPRPGHADFGQWIEMGRIPTGGGKNSGRLTAPLCAAGALCLQWLEQRGIYVNAAVESVRGKTAAHEMISEIERAKKMGDSVGGTIVCEVKGLPPGIGGALEDGVESSLSSALFAIPGVRGVEFGTGFEDARTRFGSEANDAFAVKNGIVATKTNRQGGIMGGRTNGSAVVFHLAIRPTPTVYVEQESVDLATMTPAKLSMKGRHDPCIVRRAVPVVEAVTAFAVMDAILADEAAHPRICLTLTGKTLAEDIAQYESQRYFTDMVELRVDLLKKSERAKVSAFPKMLAKSSPWKVPIVLTFRKQCDGGAFKGKEAERVKLFEKIFSARKSSRVEHVERAEALHDLHVLHGSKIGFDYVDFEEGFGGKKLVDAAHLAGVKVVRSLHKFDGPVKNLEAKLRELGKKGDIAKIAFMPRNLGDVAKAFAVARNLVGTPLRGVRGRLGEPSLPAFSAPSLPCLLIAMGPQGLATRALAGRLGAPWVYASVGGLEGIGHVTPHEFVRDFRFRSVSRSAALYGVTGWPLKKTRSPELHNAAFLNEDADALMIPFPAKTAKEAFAFMKAMGIRGMAVTIPHKFAIMPLLDKIDKFAQKVGAVNTVVCEKGKYVGYNTDVEGFAEALSSFAGTLSGKSAALLGDGGAAQAVKVALKTLGVKFKVFHRATPPQGYDILINATPVDPIPDYKFTGRELVYDLRYVPEVTPLMARAAKAGCRVENGFSMLRAQAQGQQAHFMV
jgi:chorismate synthase/shikimate 5-dehydrogenase